MPKAPSRDADHWRTYRAPEEAPPWLLDTVDELEYRLRIKFPGVFRAAAIRRQLSQKPVRMENSVPAGPSIL